MMSRAGWAAPRRVLGVRALARDDGGDALTPAEGIHELIAEKLHVDAQLTSTGEPDREGGLVAHPVRDRARDAVGQHLLARRDDLALDAPAGDRADDRGAVEGHRGADRARRAPVDRDGGADGEAAPRVVRRQEAIRDLEHDSSLAPVRYRGVTGRALRPDTSRC